jgi:RNA polymerase sigma factor (sigma-70 family)
MDTKLRISSFFPAQQHFRLAFLSDFCVGNDTLYGMSETDMELLARYREGHAEDAFAELVRRHLDLVFSAALRQVRSPQLAEEVAQSVFTDLARQAQKLAEDTILSAWLYAVARRTAIDVVRREARRQKREQLAMELSSMNADSADWSQIEPILDEAMETLDATERSAVLLRYFEKKSLREVGQALGTTEEAARKRVSRGVESLQEFFTKRGVTARAGGLAVAISANAVQGAPVGLSTAIAASAFGNALTATTTTASAATISKAIIMTTLQKTVIGVTIAAAVGAGLYQTRQISRLAQENESLKQQQSPLAEQIQQLQHERDEASNGLVAARQELARVQPAQNNSEVLKLRGEVGSLQNQLHSSKAKNSTPGMAKMFTDPAMKEYMQKAMTDKFRSMYGPLIQDLNLTKEQADAFLQVTVDRASQSLALMSAPPEDAKQATAAADQETANRLKSLLGDTGVARFAQFSGEIPARAALDLLKAQLGNNELSEDQSARLLQVVKAEPHELTQGLVGAPDKAFAGSQAEIDSFLQKVTDSNQRITQQASGFLTPQQLATLNTILTNGIQARKVQAAAFFPKQ